MRGLLLLIDRLMRGNNQTPVVELLEPTNVERDTMNANVTTDGATNTAQQLPSLAKIDAMQKDLRAMKLSVLALQQDTDEPKLPKPTMEIVEIISAQVRELRLACAQHDMGVASVQAHKVINALENVNKALLNKQFGKTDSDDEDDDTDKDGKALLAAGRRGNGANKASDKYTP